jgi:3-phosphoshikimate 1-carboxyvinyltransferase
LNATISPKRAFVGEMTAPPSKAYTHRALFAGLLSRGVTRIENSLSCDDTEATANAISCLGASVKRDAKGWAVRGIGRPKAAAKEIHCGESGVTLRFTIPIASLTGTGIRLTGRAGLMRRPIEPLSEAMNQLGVRVVGNRDQIRVEGGPPKGGDACIAGDVSSQFISGLLLAGPMMDEGLHLKLTSPLESRGYVSLTIEIMKRHGIDVKSNDEMSLFEIPSGQSYGPAAHRVPGDYSSAAFAMSAAAITGSKLLVRDLRKENSEPDSVMVEILSRMGIQASFLREGVLVEGGRPRAATIDLRDCPDLGPVMAVLGCYADGETRITGAGRLRYKESDRLDAVTTELRSLGAEIVETEDGLIASGPRSLNGGVVHSHGDHRVAMALSIAAMGARDRVVIKDAECVSKSYPTFFDDLRSLGVEIVGG